MMSSYHRALTIKYTPMSVRGVGYPRIKVPRIEQEGLMRFSVQHDHLRIGSDFHLSFQRTLRIPDDNKIYPLPPGLGCFPIRRVEDYADRVPEAWRERGGVFISMYQREAMWLAFEAPRRPVAVQVLIGRINAITGKRWREKLNKTRQNYVVCPDQPWLDGINAGNGFIRQFVAMPLGSGATVEGQLTGQETAGGIQVRVVRPKPGCIPRTGFRGHRVLECSLATPMGLGAGGRMTQKIYPDPYGWDTWDEQADARVFVHIANSEMYREITGEPPPPTPIDVETYVAHGYPWFDLYDGDLGDLALSPELAGVQSVQSLG
jgi:hypothetical protein